MIDPKLDGKVALVTGGNNPHGIGAAVALALAGQGARVFLHCFRMRGPASGPGGDRAPGPAFYAAQLRKPADEALAAIRAAGGEAQAWEADLADPASVPALFDEAERRLGPVDVLVNNAADWAGDTFLPPAVELENELVELWASRSAPVDAATFDRIFAVNARACALAMAEFARRHIGRGARWGRIINISTDGAECFPSEATYGASKLAAESYTRTAAAELGKFGITVNVLSLAAVQTGWITPELESRILPSIPMRRIGRPDDVANAVLFLASDQAGWITGQKIYVGGGHKM